MHGLELDTHRTEARLDRVHALAPVAPLANTEHALDPFEVRIEISPRERLAALVGQPGETVPLRNVPLVGAQGDLGVDRGRAADAAPREEREHLAARERCQAKRPEEVVRGLRLPAREIRRREMRACLEQHHIAATLRELARDHATAGTRADDDDVDSRVYHAIPIHDQSFARRVASGELKSISDQAPGPSASGATKSL